MCAPPRAVEPCVGLFPLDYAVFAILRVLPLQEKLNYFWIVEKKKIEDLKASLRNKERESQDLEEKHQVEIKVCASFSVAFPADCKNQHCCFGSDCVVHTFDWARECFLENLFKSGVVCLPSALTESA